MTRKKTRKPLIATLKIFEGTATGVMNFGDEAHFVIHYPNGDSVTIPCAEFEVLMQEYNRHTKPSSQKEMN